MLSLEVSIAINKRTALYNTHKRLGARLIPFGGWEMPVEYSGIAKEHTAVRTAAGLFDVSHMGEFEVRGRGALELIQRVTSNDASLLMDGQAQYSALPYTEGTVVDDLLVYRHNAEHFLLVVNAGNIDKDFDWIRSHNNSGVTVENISDRISLLAVQGPKAIEILQKLTTVPLDKIQYYHFARGKVLDADTILSRTGYTGEDGFEIYFSPEHSETIWNTLLESGASQVPEISGPASPSEPQAQNCDAVNGCMSCPPLPMAPLSCPSASVASSRVPDAPKVRRTAPASKLPSVEDTRVSPFTKEPVNVLPLDSKWIVNGTFRVP